MKINIFCLILLSLYCSINSDAPSGYNLVWSDEFEGVSLDTSKWEYNTGAEPYWGNNELEFYTKRQENVYVENGLLHIRAKKESYGGKDYTSGRIIRVVKIVVTIVVVVILFFISYFIIKLILRSRNTYYAIIRMLGGSKFVVNKLISIELFIIANISYFLYLLGVKSHEAEIINIGLFNDVSKYFSVIDYVIIYILIILMSFLLSQKYASWLFKDTAMNIYREGE